MTACLYWQTIAHALGIHPEKIVLELVETVSRDSDTLLEFVQEAKNRGFQIAIDDFGMGDSNFERLWRINPLIVKIDRSLLINAQDNSRARLLLNSLVRMIRENGSLVLIEGIESTAQAHIALATEADLLQGFLFARPGYWSEKLAQNAETSLHQVMLESDRWCQNDFKSRETYLKLLRFEIMDACHALARGENFKDVCQPLLKIEGVRRCFLLDGKGVQLGSLAQSGASQNVPFNPLYQSAGACWSHREYFRNALERPQQISCSRPYVALPDARRTITLSTATMLASGYRIFCVDIHPDKVLDGQVLFPNSL